MDQGHQILSCGFEEFLLHGVLPSRYSDAHHVPCRMQSSKTLRVLTVEHEALGGMYSKEPDSYSCLDAKNVLEPDPDDSEGGESSNSKLCIGTNGIFQGLHICRKAEHIERRLNGVVLKNGTVAEPSSDDMLASEMVKDVTNYEPDPDDYYAEANLEYENTFEPDPDDSQGNSVICAEPDPDDSQENYSTHVEPDPDDSQGNSVICAEPEPDDSQENNSKHDEPDPDDSQGNCVICAEPNPEDSPVDCVICAEPDSDGSQENYSTYAEPDPDDKSGIPCFASSFETLPAVKMLISHVLYASKRGSVLSTVKASSHDALAVGGFRVRPMEAATLLGTVVKIIEIEFALVVGGFQVRPMEAATLLGTVVKIIELLRSVVVCFFFHYDSLLRPMFSAGGNCSPYSKQPLVKSQKSESNRIQKVEIHAKWEKGNSRSYWLSIPSHEACMA